MPYDSQVYVPFIIAMFFDTLLEFRFVFFNFM